MLRFFEGFDLQDVGQWDDVSGLSGFGPGRLGVGSSAALLGASAPAVAGLGKTLDAQPMFALGFGFQPTLATAGAFAWFTDAGDNLTTALEIVDATHVMLTNGAGTVLGVASLPDVTRWHAYGLQVAFGPAGSALLFIDGAQVLTLTSVRTCGNASGTIASGFALASPDGDSYFDDVYVCDAQGTVNAAYLGDSQVVVRLPSADGARRDFTQSTGQNHYACVANVPPDGDVQFVAASAAGATDTYRIAAPAGIVQGVRISAVAKQTASGCRSVGLVVGIGSNPAIQAGANLALCASYARVAAPILETNPVTGQPWTAADLQNQDVGVKITV